MKYIKKLNKKRYWRKLESVLLGVGIYQVTYCRFQLEYFFPSFLPSLNHNSGFRVTANTSICLYIISPPLLLEAPGFDYLVVRFDHLLTFTLNTCYGWAHIPTSFLFGVLSNRVHFFVLIFYTFYTFVCRSCDLPGSC